VTRPTDAAIARAFRELSRRTSIGQPWTLDYFVLVVNKCAERFDAEAGGTDRQTDGLFHGMTFNESDAIQPDRIVVSQGGKHLATILIDSAAPYTPPDGKIACPTPTCRAELLPGQTCGGVNCGLRRT
jgi:hypothetical protein